MPNSKDRRNAVRYKAMLAVTKAIETRDLSALAEAERKIAEISEEIRNLKTELARPVLHLEHHLSRPSAAEEWRTGMLKRLALLHAAKEEALAIARPLRNTASKSVGRHAAMTEAHRKLL